MSYFLIIILVINCFHIILAINCFRIVLEIGYFHVAIILNINFRIIIYFKSIQNLITLFYFQKNIKYPNVKVFFYPLSLTIKLYVMINLSD